jgi:hypothetical protein
MPSGPALVFCALSTPFTLFYLVLMHACILCPGDTVYSVDCHVGVVEKGIRWDTPTYLPLFEKVMCSLPHASWQNALWQNVS